MTRLITITHRKKICDIIYKLYCINGAFYFSRHVAPVVKYAWISLNLTGIIFIIVIGTFGYLLISENVALINVVYVAWQANAVSYTFIFTPSLCYHYRGILERLISSIDKDFECIGVTAPESEKYQTKRNVRWVIMLQAALLTPFVSLNVVDMVFAYKVEKIKDVYRYLYPFPIDHFNSPVAYAALYAVQFIFAISMCAVGAVFPAFIIALGCEFYNTYADACARLRKISLDMTNEFEDTFNQLDDRRAIEQKNLSKSFTAKIVHTVKEYQKISSIKLIRPFIEIYYSVLLACFFTAQLANIYIILVTDIDVLLKLKQFFMLAATNTIFFTYCMLGKIFDEITEIVDAAIYALPWYYLQPDDRKVFYILLCQVQKPTRFFAFKVQQYLVTMATFPRVLNVVYSYINLLRTSLNVHT